MHFESLGWSFIFQTIAFCIYISIFTVKEGVSLLHSGVSPYEGDLFHEVWVYMF